MICLCVTTKNKDVVTSGNTIHPDNIFHIFHELNKLASSKRMGFYSSVGRAL